MTRSDALGDAARAALARDNWFPEAAPDPVRDAGGARGARRGR